jgi:hypothetical protein
VLHLTFAREAAGAAGTRHSLRPLFCWAKCFCKTSGASRRGNAEIYVKFEPRHCEERSDEAIHCHHRPDCGLLRFARNDREHTLAISRHVFARAFQFVCPSLKPEGAGNAGCALHPRSRVPNSAKKAHTSIQGSGGSPTSPAQWLYGLLRALPGERAFLPPSPLRSLLLTSLAPASRRQDHTTSPYAFVHSSTRQKRA